MKTKRITLETLETGIKELEKQSNPKLKSTAFAAKWKALSPKKQYIILGILATIMIASPAIYIFIIFSVTPESPKNILTVNEEFITSKPSNIIQTKKTLVAP